MSYKGKKEKDKKAKNAKEVKEEEVKTTEKAAGKNKDGFDVIPDPPKKR